MGLEILWLSSWPSNGLPNKVFGAPVEWWSGRTSPLHPKEKLIVQEAILCRMTSEDPPPSPERFLCELTLDGVVRFIFLYKLIKDERKLFNALMFLPDNPLTLHCRIYPQPLELSVTIEGLEKVGYQRASKIKEYTSPLIDLMPDLNLAVATRGGRPKGSGTPLHKRHEILDKCYEAILKNPKLGWSSAEIKRLTDSSENTVLGWRKDFLKSVIPKINQLRQEGFTENEIAENLETTSIKLKMYLDDAHTLKILS